MITFISILPAVSNEIPNIQEQMRQVTVIYQIEECKTLLEGDRERKE